MSARVGHPTTCRIRTHLSLLPRASHVARWPHQAMLAMCIDAPLLSACERRCGAISHVRYRSYAKGFTIPSHYVNQDLGLFGSTNEGFQVTGPCLVVRLEC